MPFPSTLVQTLDEEKVQIVAEYRAACEQAKRQAEERLALHRVKRRQLLSIIGALGATALSRNAERPGG